MGLFNSLFKINQPDKDKDNKYADSSTVDENEKAYYHADDYYAFDTHPGNPLNEHVVTFEERKKNTYASKNGLYVAEILLLYYCDKGDYPKPQKGYPAFWWFQYGIRDIGHALESLYNRGFLDLPSEKYTLTDKGRTELLENEYVVYMHKNKYTTMEGSPFGKSFTIWDVNRLLKGDTHNWREKVGKLEEERFGINIADDIHNNAKKEQTGNDVDYKEYLESIQPDIERLSKTPGDGYEEEIKGIEYKKAKAYKNALLYLYVSVEKGFDEPAVYNELCVVLKKLKLYDAEIKVIDKAIDLFLRKGYPIDKLANRRKKLLSIINK